jgi:hypothetical protein
VSIDCAMPDLNCQSARSELLSGRSMQGSCTP